MELIMGIIVGGIAGSLAGKLMNSRFSLVGNIALGLDGGFVGSILLSFIGLHGSGFIGNIIVSVVGACVLIAIGRAIKN